MALLKVLEIPDPRLRLKAEPVAAVDSEIRRLMDDMLETMYKEDGVGLAAIQVGVQKRVIVIDIEYGANTPKKSYKMANPEIIWLSEELQALTDGCLSVPGQWVTLKRAAAVHVTYLDENNKPQKIEATGLFAYCIQHEIDHLNGILFIDHLSNLKRSLLIKKLEKSRRR